MAQVSMASIPALKDSFAQLRTRMDKAVEDFRKEMASQRTGRASVHMLDSVMVEAYGSQMPLNQLANVSAPEPQLITVQPWDVSQIGAIEKAIRSGDLGLNPMNDGKARPGTRAGADRGPPQRDGEAPAQGAGRASHRGAQHPPRRQRRHQEGDEGQEDHRGRRARRAGADCRSSPTTRSRRWKRWPRAKKKK